jgi:anti-sigma B factor antagonist
VLPLDLDLSPTPYGARLTIGGELDLATTPRVRAALASLALTTGETLVVDLSDVTFMDSTGLAVFLGLQRDLRARGIRLLTACPEGAARLVVEVAGVEDELGIHPTLEAAETAARAVP